MLVFHLKGVGQLLGPLPVQKERWEAAGEPRGQLPQGWTQHILWMRGHAPQKHGG